jgi:hypothetical protein
MPGSQDDGPARDPGGRPSGRILNDVVTTSILVRTYLSKEGYPFLAEWEVRYIDTEIQGHVTSGCLTVHLYGSRRFSPFYMYI